MKSPKRLGLSFVLVSVFALTVFAGQTMAECTPPVPGQTDTPPCAAAQVTTDDSAEGEVIAPASNVEADYSVAVLAVDVVESLLLVF